MPECLEQFKPDVQPDAPLFDDDDDEDEEDEAPASVPAVSQGAVWDAGDNSVVFQGDGLRTISTPRAVPANTRSS